tara:strand:- start:82 stop:1530 length:1449 start_codon:yes stop_codon:yes gene_type:complete
MLVVHVLESCRITLGMFFLKSLPVCKQYISRLNETLESAKLPKLNCAQSLFLSICISGIIITNSVCWKRFERSSFGQFCSENLSKMFRRSNIGWELLLYTSVLNIFKTYDITTGILALDDTDNKRSKKTTAIHKAHKIKDKASGGFINGQELLFLLLITDKLTIPVGFCFYQPDPDFSEWKKQDKKLRKKMVPKSERPAKPARNTDFPTKQESAIALIKQFKSSHESILVKAILADALYGSRGFVSKVILIYPDSQVISQVKSNQKVRMHGKYISIEEYFRRHSGVEQPLNIRGGKEEIVTMNGARLYLKAHGCKRFIVALKYAGEEKYRYLVASNMTWRLTDIARAYTLRWLVEVFIQDWKGYEGWCQLAKQPGDEGSYRGVILSLMSDHCLLLHHEQKALIDNKLPAATVGSLRDLERAQAIVDSVEEVVNSQNTNLLIQSLKDAIENVIPLRESSKHMSGRDLGRLEPTPSLKRMAVAA